MNIGADEDVSSISIATLPSSSQHKANYSSSTDGVIASTRVEYEHHSAKTDKSEIGRKQDDQVYHGRNQNDTLDHSQQPEQQKSFVIESTELILEFILKAKYAQSAHF